MLEVLVSLVLVLSLRPPALKLHLRCPEPLCCVTPVPPSGEHGTYTRLQNLRGVEDELEVQFNAKEMLKKEESKNLSIFFLSQKPPLDKKIYTEYIVIKKLRKTRVTCHTSPGLDR